MISTHQNKYYCKDHSSPTFYTPAKNSILFNLSKPMKSYPTHFAEHAANNMKVFAQSLAQFSNFSNDSIVSKEV
jgi:hypothetical protein